MGTYRVDWDCCGSVSETDSWSPEECPFCTGHKLRKEVERLKEERDRLYDREAIMAKEMEEQSRIIGMSSEREARHLAEIERLKQERDAAFAKITWLRELLGDVVDLASSAMQGANRDGGEYEQSWLDDARAALKEQSDE